MSQVRDLPGEPIFSGSSVLTLDLAKALGTSPELWMNLQMMWDLRRAEARRKAS